MAGRTKTTEIEASLGAPATSAVEQLAQFENRVFGPRAPRVQGKIERGHGSLLKQLSAEDQALHAALEAQAEAEMSLSGAHAQVAAAQLALVEAEDRCTKAAETSEKAAGAAVEVQAEPPPPPVAETAAQRSARLTAEREARNAPG